MTRRDFLTGLLFGLFGSRTLIRVLASSTSNGGCYPVIIHAHSTFSDGDRTPRMLENAARSAGCSLIVTDHWEQIPNEKKLSGLVTDDFGFERYLTSFQSTPDLVVIAAAEIAVPGQGSTSHVLAIGDLRKIIGQTYSVPKDLIRGLSGAGLLAVAAHPYLNEKGRNFIFDFSMAPWIAGIEFFNQNREADQKTLAWLLSLIAAGRDIFVTAGCDTHTSVDPIGFDLARWTHKTYVWVDGDLNEESLMEGLRAGRTYAARDGARIEDLNFRPGFTIQKTKRPAFHFRLIFATKTQSNKKVFLYRDGSSRPVTEQALPKGSREYQVGLTDLNSSPGKHIYVIVVENHIITSPIVLQTQESNQAITLRSEVGDSVSVIAQDKTAFEIIFEIEVKKREGSLYFHLDSQSGKVYGLPTYGMNGYGLVFCPFANQGTNSSIRLVKRVNGIEKTLAETAKGFPRPNGFIRLRVTVEGDSITVYEKDELILKAIDHSFRRGRLLWRVYGEPGELADANFKLISLK